MPCHPARARELIKKGKAIRRYSKGLFFIRLTDRVAGAVQPVACGLDPGAKKEGFSVKAKGRTFLNVQADAVTWVSEMLEIRRHMRRARRFRKTPCRSPRYNRSRGGLPASLKARWLSKLRIARWLTSLYPVAVFVVEDVKVHTNGPRWWNASFTTVEMGKSWFYTELVKIAPYKTRAGWETFNFRKEHHLAKRRRVEHFDAHCVDAWSLAASEVGGDRPDNIRLFCMVPLRFHRRQLHKLQPSKGGIRPLYGGTRTFTLKRGSLVIHPQYGPVYVGGTSFPRKQKLSLHSLKDGTRLTRSAKLDDCTFLAYNSWRSGFLPEPKRRAA